MSLYVAIVLILALAVTGFMFYKNVPIGYILLSASLFVAIGAKFTPLRALVTTWNGAKSYNSIGFVLILTLIMMVENIMRKTGMISRMVEGVKSMLTSRKAAAMVMPAIIGLLPSPGGARFSCPLVQEAVGDDMPDERKAFLNYWFRHIWMDTFMLYPGAIMAAQFLNMNVLTLFVLMTPFMVLYILTGLFMDKRISRGAKVEGTFNVHFTWDAMKKVLINGSPIFVIIAVYLITTAFHIPFPLQIGSVVVIVGAFIIKKYSWSSIIKTFTESIKIDLIALTVGTMVFNQFLVDSDFFLQFSNLLSTYNIPKEIFYIILPFVGAYSTGITLSFVSLSFPILAGLGMGDSVWYGIAAFLAGYSGLMATPIHLCAPMTVEYFKSGGLKKLIVQASIGSIPIMLEAVALLVILRFVVK